jgi:hypothetical protein
MGQREDKIRAGEIRARQRQRAMVLGIILGAFVILIFAITIAKIKGGMPH